MKLIGYVAHNMTLGTSASRTVRLKNATPHLLRSLIASNLCSLDEIIDWNIANGILYYRITSNLIPYASHPVNTIDWAAEYKSFFAETGRKINESSMLVTMHPGQYTVLSSPNEQIVNRSLQEIEYHSKVLDLLGQDEKARIIIHLGGVYGDKESALRKWISSYNLLSPMAAKRLTIENDDYSYNVSDTLRVYEQTGVPVAFDVLHYQNLPESYQESEALVKCLETWKEQKAEPEVHFSTPAKDKPRGAHAQSIDVNAFLKFYRRTEKLRFNIMLETKDKELSVLKIRQSLHPISTVI